MTKSDAQIFKVGKFADIRHCQAFCLVITHGTVLTYNTEFNACYDKSIGSFLTCSACLLMMRSECVWGLGEGSLFS